MDLICTICQDELSDVAFSCKKATCDYKMCISCVKDAFEDSSGVNSDKCPLCKSPAAMSMIESILGNGAIKAVERDMRTSLEFEYNAMLAKKEKGKKELKAVNEQARNLFNKLSDEVSMRCPRCKMVFYDYEGCNALKCGKSGCGAAFCAICLEDCGSDAHPHVLKHHGNYFDRDQFEKSRTIRTSNMIQSFMNRIPDKPEELKLLLRNHIEKAELGITNENSRGRRERIINQFYDSVRNSLLQGVKDDRLSILQDADEKSWSRRGLSNEHISPRSRIPEDFRLRLQCKEENCFCIHLEMLDENDRWDVLNVQKIEEVMRDRPKVDALINLKQSLQCAVIAVRGKTWLCQTNRTRPTRDVNFSSDDICYLSFNKILNDGSMDSNSHDFQGDMDIIGLNPNLRMRKLENHVLSASISDLITTPIQHLIGVTKPKPIFDEILRPLPKSIIGLNMQQERVAHPLKIKTAMEVAGPPGTGKTKTIVELIRSLLECTNCNIVVLSERNGAINAIAEKFVEVSIDIKKKGGKNDFVIKDVLMWSSVLTYGAIESVGDSTRLFMLDKKLEYHPDLVQLRSEITNLEERSMSLCKSMRNRTAKEIGLFGVKFSDKVKEATYRSKQIRGDIDKVFRSPMTVINYLLCTVEEIKAIRSDCVETEIADIVIARSFLLSGLITIRTDVEIKESKQKWDKVSILSQLRHLACRFDRILKMETFDLDDARILYEKLRNLELDHKEMLARLEIDMPKSARLQMATIGSSHKMSSDIVERTSDITENLSNLSLNNNQDEENAESIVIFDEAGCIPDYELLGLTRICGDIKGIILVGDKHQLPPYDPRQSKPHTSSGRNASKKIKVKSLLDSSALKDDCKIILDTQYRVPRDVANLLNLHVYRGHYKSASSSNIVGKGLKLVHVPLDRKPRRKYVNSNEVDYALELIREEAYSFQNATLEKIMVLTPYKNQQREFEFQLGRNELSKHATVLTIDQCQGQEADVVILSLVRKPTRFLTKNRLNVALSRVRKKIFVLVDRNEMKAAASIRSWESSPIASELLSSSFSYEAE